MLGQLLAIARNTLIESIRQPVFFILVMACGLMQVANNFFSAYSMGYTDSAEVSGDNKMLLDIGLATVLVCATLLAAFLATSVVSREIEQKTALTVVSKPVGRPLFVLGKYLGIAGAIVLGTLVMLLFFLFVLERGVMTATYTDRNWPAVILALIPVGIALLIAIWGNYFYGWVFGSTTVLVMLPLLVLGYIIALFVDGTWNLHFVGNDLKPQILIACAAVMLSMLVLTAVAVAASTRLGQVMTIVVCLGVFVFSLLSNHLVGRRAFQNDLIGRVVEVETVNDRDGDFRDAGDAWKITLAGETPVLLTPETPVYYAGDPGGIEMALPRYAPFTGDLTNRNDLESPETGPALALEQVEEFKILTLRNVGGLATARPPRAGDYVFITPTEVNWPSRVAWSVIPNVQFFWLVDAVTQNHPVTLRYLGLAAGYAASHLVVLLGLGVILFQNRDIS
ncbi:MAG: ABC transporter permease [Phycisphaerales bacterium]